MRKLLFVFFLLLSFSLEAQPLPPNLRKPARLIEERHYEEALTLLEFIEKEGVTHVKTRDQIQLYVLLAKCYRNLDRDAETINYLLKAQRLNKEGSPELGKIYYSQFAEFFLDQEYYELSIRFYRQLAVASRKDFDKYLAFNRMGVMYLRLGEPEKAYECFIAQYNVATKLTEITVISSENNKAMAFIRMEKIAEAEKLLDWAYRKMASYGTEEEQPLRNSIKSNLAEIYFYRGQYKQSAALLEEVMTYQYSQSGFTFSPEEDRLARCYAAMGEAGKLKLLLTDINTRFYTMETPAKIKFVSLLQFSAEQGITIARKPDSRLMSGLLKQAEEEEVASDSKRNQFLSIYLEHIGKLRLSVEKRNQQSLVRSLNVTRAENAVYGLLVLLLLVIGVSLLVFFRRRSRMQQKELEIKSNLQQLEKERLEFQNRVQQQNLVELSLEFDHTITQNKFVITELSRLKDLSPTEMKKKIREVIMDLKQQESEQLDITRISKESQANLRLLKARLKEEYADLSKTELKLCMLILLDFSNKQIAAAMNVAENSVKMYKNRLSKKMGLENAMQLSEHLHSFALLPGNDAD